MINALERLIHARLGAIGLTQLELARRLGFSNLNSIMRKLPALLASADLPTAWRVRLADELGLEGSELDAASARAMEEKKQEQAEQDRLFREEARRSFRPHLWVKTVRSVPSPIFIVALFGVEHFLLVELPDGIATWEEDRAVAAVRAAIRSHEASGSPFGATLGYYYQHSFGAAVEFDLEGNYVANVQREALFLEASLTVDR